MDSVLIYIGGHMRIQVGMLQTQISWVLGGFGFWVVLGSFGFWYFF